MENQHVPEGGILRLVGGGVALTCAFPSDWHTLAEPVKVQLGAASASGATAIAAALAPATNSGGMKVRILLMALFLCWPALVGLPC